ncbi:sporulation protein [Clostridium botulinum]|uniref:ParA family protein n=1 Tax=Clostridium botulinum TaxID=1491 RepID=UPI000174E462|nr:ParA family protein [Clostridium botulinum]ACD52929.1 sporulation initiation inhibitor protein soj [Clostridium botulinum E3 str. Alaska E43]AJF29714.1 sporulation protein [Clostridium botulinum]AJF32775.1 sporulation protein [Clostridium botulinum]MBY6949109.1 ParA family protein [Clostridium botulinum]MBY7022771.1 ParA family protein [Clostridium botulinum]
MKIISFLNIKGGVAKTTSCVNVAAQLGKEGKNVLIIDIDPQSNATKYLNMYDSHVKGTYEVLRGEDISIQPTKYDGLWLLPGNINLIMSEGEILTDTKRVKETRLKTWLSVKDQKAFDYILIDCPPSLGMLSTNALVASDYVIVPLKIDKFGLDGFEYLMSSIEGVGEQFNHNLNLLGILITMDKSTRIHKEIKQELKEELGDLIFNQTIRDNVDIVKSTFESTPVVYLNSRANASRDYKKFVEELQCRLI